MLRSEERRLPPAFPVLFGLVRSVRALFSQFAPFTSRELFTELLVLVPFCLVRHTGLRYWLQ